MLPRKPVTYTVVVLGGRNGDAGIDHQLSFGATPAPGRARFKVDRIACRDASGGAVCPDLSGRPASENTSSSVTIPDLPRGSRLVISFRAYALIEATLACPRPELQQQVSVQLSPGRSAEEIDWGDNSAITTAQIPCVDLVTTQTSSTAPGTVLAGRFVVSVTNPSHLSRYASFADRLPPGLAVQEWTCRQSGRRHPLACPQASWLPATRTLTMQLAIPAHTTLSVELAVSGPAGTYRNNASIRAEGYHLDLHPESDTSSSWLRVVSTARR